VRPYWRNSAQASGKNGIKPAFSGEIVLEIADSAVRMVQSGILFRLCAHFLGLLLSGHGMGYSGDALDKLLKILGNSPNKMCTNLGNAW
jgi:hypothetical protein